VIEDGFSKLGAKMVDDYDNRRIVAATWDRLSRDFGNRMCGKCRVADSEAA
jgi:hypothetical protein